MFLPIVFYRCPMNDRRLFLIATKSKVINIAFNNNRIASFYLTGFYLAIENVEIDKLKISNIYKL